MTKILIVDDESAIRDVMARALKRRFECLTAADGETALALVGENPDLKLMLSDIRMPGMDGVELLRRARKLNPSLACILLTAYGTVDLAVGAMKDGAADFIQKPITDLDALEARIDRVLENVRLKDENTSLRAEVESLRSEKDAAYQLENFTGRSEPMKRVYQRIRQAAKSSASVLIEGPSGTGKELVAHALHNLSPRAKGPFVAVECAALSSSLLESELFGHEKNAFTDAKEQVKGRFEIADGGTLFLDEIGEIDLPTQVKLLRVLENHTFQRVGGTVDIRTDFRLVAATNKDLLKLIAAGTFREDLYYRINVIDIDLPALKDRPGDIALLVARFLDEFSKANGGAVKGIDAKAMAALEAYDWPGNVRQLRNVIEKMVVLSPGGRLTLEDVPLEVLNVSPRGAAASAPPVLRAPGGSEGADPGPRETAPQSGTLEAREKEHILATLEACRWNKSKAALELGISRRTLHRKLNLWGVQ